MGKEGRKHTSLILWASFAALLAHNLVIPVMSTASFEEQKTYYSPDPNARSPPTGSHKSPSHSGGGHGTSPSHGTPSHGSSSHGGTPPANCGNPAPSGGHHHNPTPSPPSGGHGGGGYYPSPPSHGGSPPSTPTPTPRTPSTPTPTPSTPSTPTPSTPSTPSAPGVFPIDPNSPPFTCDYWRTHPTLIWGILGWWGSVGNAFGVASVPALGANMNLVQALSNTRPDGLGELYREGTASLLNSMVSRRFTYTTDQVKNSFITALSSDKSASAQAQLFKLANEGRLKPRA
ncbi:PREDICTED: protodermal factor 1-like isoform X2 [Nicotiana attenuata]|uniref:protodermal factor 1-like isoform X2 n=1 Tax=Nicotiana attenuata TaxID=49451 RepID=UPI0009048EE3|nr:PREDICTED: protodermal factor 1-like isoform X2 [Nicotiana attenuata]